MRTAAGAAAVAGFALILAAPLRSTMETLAQVPPSLILAAGLVPLMLIGQLLTTRKRSR